MWNFTKSADLVSGHGIDNKNKHHQNHLTWVMLPAKIHCLGFICESFHFRNFEIPNFRVLGQNDILGVGPIARHKEYYNAEGGGFPQVRAMVSLMNPCLLVAYSCTKCAPTMH